MKKVGFSDWQEMALKKDVEDIKRKSHSQEPILLSVCWEIVIAVGTIIIDHLFDTEKTPTGVWCVVIVLATTPPMLVLIYKLISWGRSVYQIKKGNFKIRAYVDLFDNQVSYWVMLSNSYANMLTEALNDGSCTQAEQEFLYREGCYYNNKSMQALYRMKPNFEKIFSNDIEVVKRENLIDLARLNNILQVMKEQQIRLDQDIKKVQCEGISLQQELNRRYLADLEEFENDIKAYYS